VLANVAENHLGAAAQENFYGATTTRPLTVKKGLICSGPVFCVRQKDHWFAPNASEPLQKRTSNKIKKPEKNTPAVLPIFVKNPKDGNIKYLMNWLWISFLTHSGAEQS
jgi:hypothetical protein